MDKIFSLDFKLDSKILLIIYICYHYKFPLSIMLSFYEYYGDKSMFAFKVLSCLRRTPINDNILVRILDESRILYKQILKGISIIKKAKEEGTEISEYPGLDLTEFSPDYKEFIENYLLKNIKNLYTDTVNLRLSTEDLYEELI